MAWNVCYVIKTLEKMTKNRKMYYIFLCFASFEKESRGFLDDQELPAQSTNDTHVVICDFSQVTTINESNESKERDERQRSNNSEIRVSTIYVVRSPQLADATRHFQTPLQIGISNAVGVSQVGAAGIQQGQGGSNTVSSVIDDFVPIDADQRNQFVVVRFTNDLNSLEFYVDKEGEKKGSDGVNSMKNETAESTFAAKLNLSQEERKTNFSCAHFIDKSSIQLLGGRRLCSLYKASRGVTEFRFQFFLAKNFRKKVQKFGNFLLRFLKRKILFF